MFDIDHVSFSYSRKYGPALCDLTVEIPSGIMLLAGENGAGKTTLLHAMAGLLTPQQGSILFDGIPVTSDRPGEAGRIFLLEENVHLPGKTIWEFSRIHSPFYPRFSREAFLRNLDAFGLTGNEPMARQSLGNRKKAQLAYALALGTDALLLDEPTNGLDIQSKAVLRKLLVSEVRPDQTVVISTHTVTELHNLFEGTVMIRRGHLLLAATAEHIADSVSFTRTRYHDPAAVYSELALGAYNEIVEQQGEDSKIDWLMLYKAMHTQNAESIREAICSRTPGRREMASADESANNGTSN